MKFFFQNETKKEKFFLVEDSGLGSSGHDFGHFLALCEGIFSGQLGLFRGYKKFLY